MRALNDQDPISDDSLEEIELVEEEGSNGTSKHKLKSLSIFSSFHSKIRLF